jgi:hypothetical protein
MITDARVDNYTLDAVLQSYSQPPDYVVGPQKTCDQARRPMVAVEGWPSERTGRVRLCGGVAC